MTINILAMSDLHLEFGECEFQLEQEPDLLILAGDIGYHTGGIKVASTRFGGNYPKIVICGNHEHYRLQYEEVLAACQLEAERTDDVYFLEQQEACFDIRDEQVRILGCTLWTDFAVNGLSRRNEAVAAARQMMNDFRLIRFGNREFDPADTIDIHRDSLAWLEKRLSVAHAGPTIVVTHHAPSNRSQPPQFIGGALSPAFASDLENLILQYQPELWVHGHTHWSVDYQIGATRIYSNQKGYPGERTGFCYELIQL
jgi:Icc-related predicted phosphoesterase